MNAFFFFNHNHQNAPFVLWFSVASVLNWVRMFPSLNWEQPNTFFLVTKASFFRSPNFPRIFLEATRLFYFFSFNYVFNQSWGKFNFSIISFFLNLLTYVRRPILFFLSQFVKPQHPNSFHSFIPFQFCFNVSKQSERRSGFCFCWEW